KMRFALRPPRETFADAAWVSHVKIDVREFLDDQERSMTSDTRLVVQHIKVFKKPSTMDVLPVEIVGTSMGGFTLERGKEYLLCGSILEDGTLTCVGGQIRPAGVEGMVAEWREITEEFKEEMKTY
ncbi:hypothetical protein PMAYCL1PPCAC_17109, partial [Pristionchus mayeri]